MNSLPSPPDRIRFVRAARRMRGFTSIELLMVVLAVAILAALALPSFNSTVSRYRVRTAVEDFTATIYVARSEAIKRGGGVVVRKATQTGCSATEVKNWSCGWTVFVDLNGNGALDKGDEVLQQTPAPRGVHVQQTRNVSLMKLSQWGDSNGMGAFGVVISPTGNEDVAFKTTICVSGGGSLRVLTSADACPR